jgi:hypothetical protein
VLVGDLPLGQDEGETGRGRRRQAVAEHLLEAGAQGAHIGPRALRAAVVEGPPALLLDHQGQGERAQVRALRCVWAPLGAAGPAGEGGHAGVGVGGVGDQARLSQAETLWHPVQQLPLQRGARLRSAPGPRIPEAWATHLVPGGRHPTGQPRGLRPCGQGPLALGPHDAVEGRPPQRVAHRQGGASRWGSRRDMGVDQRKESQRLRQGVAQGGGAKLPGLHGGERREGLRGGGGGPLGTALRYHPVPGTEVARLDEARGAVAPSGAPPVEIGASCVPCGEEAGQNGGRVTV